MFENPPLIIWDPDFEGGGFLKDLKNDDFHRVPPMKNPKIFRPPSAAPQKEGFFFLKGFFFLTNLNQ